MKRFRMSDAWRLFFGFFPIVCIVGLQQYDWSKTFHTQLNELWSHIDAQLSPRLGKTHFIVGQTPTQQKQHIKYLARTTKQEPIIYFSPDDDVRTKLLNVIQQEQQHIAIAVFTFTDKEIAHALVDAHKRGIKVELVIDAVCLRDRYNKIGILCDAGISVYVYNAQYAKKGLSSSMHHKFVLFDSCVTVWTGSCNFTRSAYDSNQENVVLLTGAQVVQKFTHQFGRLKERSYKYEKQ